MSEKELYNQLEEYDKEIIKLSKKNKKLKEENKRLNNIINKSMNTILKDISIIKTVPMTKQEIVYRLKMTGLILKGEEK